MLSVSKLIKDDKKPVEINLTLEVILYLPRLFFLEAIFKELKRAQIQKEKNRTTAKTPKINQHCYLSSLRESISGGITETGKNYTTEEGFISLKSSPSLCPFSAQNTPVSLHSEPSPSFMPPLLHTAHIFSSPEKS